MNNWPCPDVLSIVHFIFPVSVWYIFLSVSRRGRLLCEQRPESTWSLTLSYRMGRMLMRETGRKERKREYKWMNMKEGKLWQVKKRAWERKGSWSINTDSSSLVSWPGLIEWQCIHVDVWGWVICRVWRAGTLGPILQSRASSALAVVRSQKYFTEASWPLLC